MHKALDNLLSWVKWPVALMALAVLPGLVSAWGSVVLQPEMVDPWLPVLAGLIGYALLWGVVFKHRQTGSFLPTFFHELSHAVVALCTFHRVGDLRAGWSSGGRVTIYGGTNWLILVAPYCLGLAPILAALFVFVGPDEWRQASLCGFGAAVAFYGLGLLSDVHGKQTDLQSVGLPFAWCFLPSANLLVLGILLTGTVEGAESASIFFEEVLRVTQTGIDRFL